MGQPVYQLQTSFNNGEIDPRLHVHVDLEKYFSSLAIQENNTGLKQGGSQRRSGFRHVAPTKTNSGNIVLREFEFNVEQAYQIEIGALYFRFFADQGQVESAPSVPLEVAHPYADADIPELYFTQSADVLFITHEDYPPAKLTRTSPTSFTYEELELIDGPFLVTNTDYTKTVTTTGSGVSRTITVTGDTPFTLVTDVDRLIRIDTGTPADPEWISFKITSVTSTSEVVADIQIEDPSTVNNIVDTVNWRMGAWSDTTSWPAKCTFHQQRLVLMGGKGEEAQAVNMSESGIFTEFSPTEKSGTITDSNGIRVLMDTDRVNAIEWAKSAKALVVGTRGASFSITSYDDQVLAPTNIKVDRENQYGSESVDAEFIGRDIVHVQRHSRKLRELTVDAITGNLDSLDTTLWARHITVSGVAGIAYQQEPDTVLWSYRNDGVLLSCTIDKQQNVRAWARHPLGGTDVKVLAVSTIPSSEINRDEVWIIVERTIDGQTVRYVEFLEKEFDFETSLEDGFFVDSGLTYEGAATNTLTGLDHLEGETVQILGNGSVRNSQVVTGGEVTVSGTAVTKAHVGLGYDSLMETLTPEVPTSRGIAQGRKQRIHKCTINLYRTVGLEFGRDSDSLDRLPFRNTDDNMNEAIPLFTGIKDVVFPSGWDNKGKVVIRQNQPLPMTVLSIIPRMKIERP
jgi:hypothetical protein